MRKREALLALAGAIVLLLASMAAAQDPKQEGGVTVVPAATDGAAPADDAAPADPTAAADPDLAFEREVFTYSGAGRRDPFKPLTDEDAIGPLFDDLSLRMIIYSAVSPGESVAVLADGQKKTYRVRRGDYVGSAAVVEIGPKRVVFSINELGNRRQEVLELKRDK